MYLHSDKERNYETGIQLGLSGNALSNFQHALYEVEFEVEVNPMTGDTTIISVDGIQLCQPKQDD